MKQNEDKIKVLSIGLDESILTGEYGSAIERQQEYAKHLRFYNLVILNVAKKDKLSEYKRENLRVIPTNSTSRWKYIFDALKKAGRLGDDKFDVISSQDPFITGLIGVIAKYWFGKPLNIQLHSDDIISKVWREHSVLNRLLYGLGVWVLHRADSFRFDNKRKMDQLIERFPRITKRVYKAPMFVDLSLFKEKVRKKKKLANIIAVGRLSWEKNFETLIKVVSELIDKGYDLKLEIVGGGPEEGKLKGLIGSLNKKGKIRVEGFATKEKVKLFMKKSDLLVISSHYEGWGMVAMEAMAAGVPVVMTKVGHAGELVIDGKTGIVAEKNDHVGLRNAIEKLLKNPKLAFSLACEGQKKVMKENSKNKLISAWMKCLYETSKIKS